MIKYKGFSVDRSIVSCRLFNLLELVVDSSQAYEAIKSRDEAIIIEHKTCSGFKAAAKFYSIETCYQVACKHCISGLDLGSDVIRGVSNQIFNHFSPIKNKYTST